MACTEYLEVSCTSIVWCSFVFQNAPFKPIKQILHDANSSFINFVPLTTLSLGIIVAIVGAGILDLVLSPFSICTLPSDWHNGEQGHEREMINADREDAVKNDSFQSYETVKYFGAESYKFEHYLKLYVTTAIVAIQPSIFCAMNISIQSASYCDMTAYSS